ncbi:Thioredoxin F, chloroplastic [Zea mays]|uniref:Thioredoxin F, chloroplastic n=2 Tax=Zea mays TaxID=4577 RepID=A0A8J8XU78_MAIZE|nr:Putative thioredoxin superfamily protein [Zea mays]PWZ45838.1 Thioredoxin F, chloroplastic [Zea mays]
MALRLPISSSHGLASTPAPISTTTCRPAVLATAAAQKRSLLLATASETRGVAPVRSSGIETSTVGLGCEAVTGQVTEVNKDTFWPIVEAAGDKVVVLDMYTEWCGPCKVMAPKFQEMSEKNLDVVFLKLDCNQDNKPLAKELGIKVVPTFKILKGGKVVKEVTGAKIDELAQAIDTVKSD